MNKMIKLALATICLSSVLLSCSNDEEFGNGEGLLKMQMIVSGDLSRTVPNEQDLRDNCIIYISNTKGLIHKFKGIENVPTDLFLKSGGYVAEAWTGDSVSASFDKQFYKAYETFSISKGEVKNVVLNCKIANVVASIKPDEKINEAVKNYMVTIANTKGSLDFTAENVDARGFYMMPNGDNALTWKIEGERMNGETFLLTGRIENVKRAHEYTLNINCSEQDSQIGGAFLNVVVDDTELIIEDSVELLGAPVISGVGYDIDSPITGVAGSFDRKSVYIQNLGELTQMRVSTSDYVAMGMPTGDFDFMLMNDDARNALAAAGVTCDYTYDATANLSATRISFSENLINKLTNGDYSINLTAIDSNGKKRLKTLTIKVSDASVVLQDTPWTEIYAYRAKLHGMIMKQDVTNPGFRYRAVGATDWAVVTNVEIEGENYSAELTGLLSNTTYEYQAISDGYVDNQVKTFKTETIFSIPNSSFEDWSEDTNYKKDNALIAGAGGYPTFWDSGNHGTKSFGGNITTNSTDMVQSGTYSAKLRSTFAGIGSIGKFAAGNIFAGTFNELNMSSMSARLSFGREFNGSRPIKLVGYANYRPGKVDKSGSHIAKDVIDNAQIYVALTTQVYEIDPAAGKLFAPTDSSVLAYGEITWTGNFGEDGKLQQFEIPLTYNAGAALTKATHIVLVATASKFGDYFEGSTSSVLYIDDFSFVYE